MITNTFYGVRETVIAFAIIAALALAGIATAHAQTTTYIPPAGYQSYGTSGIFYNPSTGVYYNALTGQTSNLQPLGPANRDINGAYIVGAGYVNQNNGYYFNSATGFYYDPALGFYSNMSPVNTGVTLGMINYGGGTFVPGVPNTGAGGDAGTTLLVLAITAAVAGIGSVALSKRRTA